MSLTQLVHLIVCYGLAVITLFLSNLQDFMLENAMKLSFNMSNYLSVNDESGEFFMKRFGVTQILQK